MPECVFFLCVCVCVRAHAHMCVHAYVDNYVCVSVLWVSVSVII